MTKQENKLWAHKTAYVAHQLGLNKCRWSDFKLCRTLATLIECAI